MILIQLAYDVVDSQITHKPEWLDSDLWDVTAKPEEGTKLSREELRPRLQDLLHQRFHLVAHTETQTSRGYALVAAKGGPHLVATKGEHFPGWRINVSSGHMQGSNWSLPQLAKYLTPAAGFPVIDLTEIGGSYDFDFLYDPHPTADSTLPSLDEALKLATGLLLRPEKVPVKLLVIDSVDRTPTAN